MSIACASFGTAQRCNVQKGEALGGMQPCIDFACALQPSGAHHNLQTDAKVLLPHAFSCSWTPLQNIIVTKEHLIAVCLYSRLCSSHPSLLANEHNNQSRVLASGQLMLLGSIPKVGTLNVGSSRLAYLWCGCGLHLVRCTLPSTAQLKWRLLQRALLLIY